MTQYQEKSIIIRVTATCEYEYFNVDSVARAKGMAMKDAQEELDSIFTGTWKAEKAEFQREETY